jgi:hypothetical protein
VKPPITTISPPSATTACSWRTLGKGASVSCTRASGCTGAPGALASMSPSPSRSRRLVSSDTSRMKSADGLIDLRLSQGLAEVGELYYSSLERVRVPRDQFTSQTGIGGVDAAGSAELEYSTLGFWFAQRPDVPLASGILIVSGSGGQLTSLMWGGGDLSCPP